MSLDIPDAYLHRADGAIRRLGVEIEFAGLTAADAAQLVAETLNGTVRRESAHRFEVSAAGLGPFTVELDLRHAHPGKPAWLPEGAPFREELTRFVDTLDRDASEFIGDVSGLVVPTEIASPPLPMDQLDRLDPMLNALRAAGAAGTAASIAYAFGTQLNPELITLDAAYIRRHIQAYLLLSPWLRAEIQPDMTRRVLPFVHGFPDRYLRRVLDPAYAPDLAALIGDYLADNPTRNRELDLLPLFAHLAPDIVAEALPGEKIQPRPTFHYRLPNTRLEDPDWRIEAELRRWLEVEKLAANRAGLERRMAAWRRGRGTGWPSRLRTRLTPLRRRLSRLGRLASRKKRQSRS